MVSGIRIGLVPGNVMMINRIKNSLFILIFLTVLTAGCVAPYARGRLLTRSEEVGLENAETARVEILMGAGRLKIAGGAESLLLAHLRYSHPGVAPDILYRVKGSGLGVLDIEQEEYSKYKVPENYRNEWDLALNSEVPLALFVTLGAGESDLNVGELNLKSFTMQMGVGESTLHLEDYSGEDLTLDIQGGVGELTLYLPAESRVEVDVRGGLGEINSFGLIREDGHYVSGGSDLDTSIKIEIRAGIGQLNLIAR